MAFLDGKYIDLTYVANNEFYTESISGKGSITIEEDGTHTVFLTVTYAGEAVESPVYVGSEEYNTDAKGRLELEIRGKVTITVSEELTLTAEYSKGIGEKFDETEAEAKEHAKRINALDQLFLEQNNKLANALTVALAGNTHLKLTDVSPIEHDMKIRVTDTDGLPVQNADVFVNSTLYTSNEDGFVTAKSIYPTTIISVTEGVNIEVEYNKDINEAIKSHETQIKENKASAEQRLKALEGSISDTNNRVGVNERQIELLESDSSVNTSEHNVFVQSINTIDTDVTKLKSQTDGNANKITSLEERQDNTVKEISDIRGEINVLPSKAYVDNTINEKEKALQGEIVRKANAEDVNKALEDKANGVNGVAIRASADAFGNDIADTYATKKQTAEIEAKLKEQEEQTALGLSVVDGKLCITYEEE